MNRRVILFLSIGLIGVGVVGIFLNASSKSSETPQIISEVAKIAEKKRVVIAEALKDLNPKDILRAGDYQLRTIEVDKDSTESRNIDVLHSKTITGFLNLHFVARGNAIMPAGLESPNSKTFAIHSLKDGEIFWDYPFRAHDNYLSELTIGQTVSLFLRSAMIKSQKEQAVSRLRMDGSRDAQKVNKFEMNRITGPLEVIAIQRFDTESSEQKKDDKAPPVKNSATNLKKDLSANSYVGWLTLRIKSTQLARVKSIEKSGEIIAIPGELDAAAQRITTDQVIPHMHTHNVTELRGGK
jgi:pilus assembly protein CpaB